MARTKPSISVLGLGRVGLCFAVCCANRGFHVVGVDVDEEKLDMIGAGKAPFYEPGLQAMLEKAVEKKDLELTASAGEAVARSEVSFITVGTPGRPDGSVDLSQIESACRDVGKALAEKGAWHLVVVRSTVPPGTTGGLIKDVLEISSGLKCGRGFGLCMNPEFLSEGNAIRGILEPDRIVIGEYDKRSGDALQAFYEQFHGNGLSHGLILRTSLINAELIKYASNAFLAMKVSFANMIAHLCQLLPGADVVSIMDGVGLDKRIGRAFLNAGLGWGGSCFPKDLAALLKFAEGLGLQLPLVKATVEVNERQPLLAIELAKKVLGTLEGKRVALLGLAFKPGTDDIRGAVSLKLIEALLAEGADIVAYDPMAMENVKALLGSTISYASSAREALREADCCIIVTEWEEFRTLRPEDFKELMRKPVVIDGRRIFRPKDFEQVVHFLAIGRGPRKLT
ncbi:MAG: UDP-glucose 6-dehydrogenase [Thermoprotei archaeon]|nr:MAG: UDP-glucose 6-dehydrogenase [Thermoprotei archaeon]